MKAITWTDTGWVEWDGHPCLECETDALVVLLRNDDPRSAQGIVLATGEEVASICVGELVDLAPTLSDDHYLYGYTEWIRGVSPYPVVRVPLAEYAIYPVRSPIKAHEYSEWRSAIQRLAAAVTRAER
jgi:hypothetical protein